MADLMGSYIPDLVLKIDNGELVQLLNHLPNVPAHQSFWEKFFDTPMAVVGAGSALCTVIFSFLTWRVTSTNSRLTKQFSEANHDLAKQQTATALENKEIAKRKYNLDVINKRWSFLQAYLDGIDIICRSIVMEFTEECPEKLEEKNAIVFSEYRLKDIIRKKKSYNEIKSYDIIFKSFLSLETEKYFQKTEEDIEILFNEISTYKFDESAASQVSDLLIEYENHLEKYKNEIYHSRSIFTASFIGIELDGMKLI